MTLKSRISTWATELNTLCRLAQFQPHAACAAQTLSLLSKWTYLQRKVPGIHHLFQPLEDILCGKLLSSLTGQSPSGALLKKVLALPAQHGVIDIPCPTAEADYAYLTSTKIYALLIANHLPSGQICRISPCSSAIP